MKDAQALVEFFADACYKKDPVSFMDRVRKECGPILENADAAGAAAEDVQGDPEAAVRGGRAAAVRLGRLRPSGAQGQEGRGPG